MNHSKLLNKLPVQVLGATGQVGEKMIELLLDHPFFYLGAVSASEKSVGKKLKEFFPKFANQLAGEMIIGSCAPCDCPIVFSALNAAVALKLEKEFVENGKWVFSNASAYRMDPDFLLSIPEIHGKELKNISQPSIITNPNCCVSGIALSIYPLLSFFKINRISMVTQQGVSGAGFHSLYAHEILDNIVCSIENEEEKISKELSFILSKFLKNDEVPILTTCTRVPVRHTHLIHIEIESTQSNSIKKIEETYLHFEFKENLPSSIQNPIVVFKNPYEFNTQNFKRTVHPMQIAIGKISTNRNILRYSLFVDNLLRGAAGICLLNAEFWYHYNYETVNNHYASYTHC